jgi:hypothetical protein
MKSEDVAFARLAAIGPSAAEKARNDEIQRSISRAMVDVVRRDARHDVHYMDPLGVSAPGLPAARNVTPQGAAKVDDLPVPLLPGAPTPRPIPWDHIRLGKEPEEKAGEEKE